MPVTKPIISGRMNYGIPLSIIGCHPTFLPWLVSRFVNLHFQSRDQFDSFNFSEFPLSIDNEYYKPFLDRWADRREIVDEIIPFIIRHIQAGHYLIFFVNKFHIPQCIWHNRTYHPHPVFVYGYDRETETIYTKSFDEGFRFIDVEVGFAQMHDAFHTIEERSLPNPLIRYMRYDASASYSLNLESIRRQANEFLQGSSKRDSRALGIAIYPVLEEKIAEMKSQPFQVFDSFLLRKHAHIIWEHALIMEHRMQVLAREQIIDDPALQQLGKQLTQQCLIFRNLLIKYHIRQDQKLLGKVMEEVDRLKTGQWEAVTRLVAHL
ncbi:hypothetical protein DUZ99_05300 [Xylanibacillus composti]|uniref:Butirosin biosynthesis protein H-like n=1 Tax=Xylanibacillus composti TaxID=1572762 RepID=A0A8J4M1E8_9BACL|nr:hypothetical protein [Xylanibacillus composti]GIQ68000.1 hypothetical protein XYCOK13_08240 [Xylanibacillus composti]